MMMTVAASATQQIGVDTPWNGGNPATSDVATIAAVQLSASDTQNILVSAVDLLAPLSRQGLQALMLDEAVS